MKRTAVLAPLLTATRVSLAYGGSPVVIDATLELRAGQVLALVGPNGSGKSTLLRSLARLHRPRSGEVTVDDGRCATALTSREFARTVTLLAQSRPTPGGVAVRDVVGYGRHPYRGRWRAQDAGGADAVARAMALTGVAAMADRSVDELSGGELQRVWLATCLAQDTDVLLLDEPTTYLDLRYQVEILDLIRDLADDHGAAVGVVLHDLNQAALVADRVALLHDGRIAAVGSPCDVLTSTALTEAYGIAVAVESDPVSGQVTTRPVGRHSARRSGLAPV